MRERMSFCRRMKRHLFCSDFSKTEAVAYHRQAEDPEKDDKEIGKKLHYNQIRRCKKLWIK